MAHRPVAVLALAGSLAAGLVAPPTVAAVQPAVRTAPADGLAVDPVLLDELGVSIRPPAGATARTETTPDGAALLLVDGALPRRWSMRIQLLSPSIEAETPRDQVDALVELRRARAPELALVDARAVERDGRAGYEAWTTEPAPTEADPEASLVGYWSCVDFGSGLSLAVVGQVRGDALPDLRPVLDACVSTLRFQTPMAGARARGARIDAGEALLEGLGEEDLRAVAGREWWFTLVRRGDPAANEADREAGYMQVVSSVGPRGAVQSDRDPGTFEAAERTEGLLVTVRARVVDAASDAVYDSEAVYWLRFDGDEEVWSVRGTWRVGNRAISEAQTGIRRPQSVAHPDGRVTVIDVDRRSHRVEREWATPEAYLSQPLRWMLGPLLAGRTNADEAAFSWYAIEGRGESIAMPLRTDRWTRATEGPGVWRLRTEIGDDPAAVDRTWFDGEGNLLRRESADGVLLERTEPALLRRRYGG